MVQEKRTVAGEIRIGIGRDLGCLEMERRRVGEGQQVYE